MQPPRNGKQVEEHVHSFSFDLRQLLFHAEAAHSEINVHGIKRTWNGKQIGEYVGSSRFGLHLSPFPAVSLNLAWGWASYQHDRAVGGPAVQYECLGF